jgi:ABC-type transporter MlaC component
VNLKLIVTILVIAAAPICAQAQKLTPVRVTKADAQKVLKIISSDKAKTRIYCEIAELGDQMEQANEKGDAKKFDELFQKMYELGKTLGPEYAALIDGLQDIDPESDVGREISSTLDALDNLCGG